MAPGFLSKFKATPSPNASQTSREANKSSESPRDNGGSPEPTRGRAKSTVGPNGSSLAPPTITTTDASPTPSLRNSPSLTIIPPTPRTSTYGGMEDHSRQRAHTLGVGRSDIDGLPMSSNEDPMATPVPRRASNASNTSEWDFTTGQANPTTTRPKALTPSSSKSSLRKPNNGALPPTIDVSVSPHVRASTSPAGITESPDAIVESPTAISAGVAPTVFSQPEPAPAAAHPPRSGSMFVQSSATLMTPKKDSDSASINSTSRKKTAPWRKNTSPARKPTGLASALAASGMAMANPAMGRDMSPPPMPPPPAVPSTSSARPTSRKSSTAAPASTRSTSPRGSMDQGTTHHRGGSRANSISMSENHSEYFEDSETDSESQSDGADLGMNENDIPVTGFAVASNRRNADFHELFPTVPEGDYLIEDYGCALQREILIQGRIYISENHICFHANIFGWVTDLSIPIYEIISIERKMTAFVIPNGIQVTTRQAKYNFASFLARDTTFDVIYNIWRLARPDDVSFEGGSSFDGSNSRTALDGRPDDTPSARRKSVGGLPGKGVAVAAAKVRQPTICACGKDKTHYPEVAMDAVLPGTPDTIYNLIFASGFIKDFMKIDQKLIDVQISDWTPMSSGSKLLSRNMSYIKPLNGSIGPKQTKCEIKDETVHLDFDDYVCTITTTRTPDVPSGGVFSVKTRTCIMWASAVSSKVVITSQIEWTGRSFIKGIIERSALEGQRAYHVDLDTAMRKYIQEHQSEFVPEGVDPAALDPVVDLVPSTPKESDTAGITDASARERDRNQRGLQWAWDTFEGASQVAVRSTKGALELIRDTWDQSTSTSILYALVVVLVISNIWTLMMVGGREETGRKKEMAKTEEREKWVQGVVTALWDEMAAGKVPGHVGAGVIPPPSAGPLVVIHDSAMLAQEVDGLQKALDVVEQRLQKVRDGLVALSAMQQAKDLPL